MSQCLKPQFPICPPVDFTKGWKGVERDLSTMEGHIELRDKFEEWVTARLPTHLKATWKNLILVFDFVLPNPLSHHTTVDGFLFGRPIGASTADDVLNRHEQSVVALKTNKASIGLHRVFLKGIPKLNTSDADVTWTQLSDELRGKTVADIKAQHFLVGAIEGSPEATPISATPTEAKSSLRIISYAPRDFERFGKLASDRDRKVTQNWEMYLSEVSKKLPEARYAAAFPIALPPGDLASLSDQFVQIGHLFVLFTENMTGRENDLHAILAVLSFFALYCNAAATANELARLQLTQRISHEIGEITTALRNNLVSFSNTNQEGLALRGQGTFFKPVYDAVLVHLQLWESDQPNLRPLGWFAGESIKKLIHACWDACLLFHAGTKFGEKLADGDPDRGIETWYRRLQACLVVEGSFADVNLPKDIDPEAPFLLARGICAAMRDVLKHALDLLQDLPGQRTTWRVDQCNAPPQISAGNPCLRIEQSNPRKSDPDESGRHSGMTRRVIQRNLPEGALFERHDDADSHHDVWTVVSGSLFAAMFASE